MPMNKSDYPGEQDYVNFNVTMLVNAMLLLLLLALLIVLCWAILFLNIDIRLPAPTPTKAPAPSADAVGSPWLPAAQSPAAPLAIGCWGLGGWTWMQLHVAQRILEAQPWALHQARAHPAPTRRWRLVTGCRAKGIGM